MSRSIKCLILAGVVSFAAAAVAQAGGRGGISGDFHASAAPACDGTSRSQKTGDDGQLFRDWCRVLATDGPGSPTDGTGRGGKVTDDGPGTAGDHNGRAELSTDPHTLIAGGRGGI